MYITTFCGYSRAVRFQLSRCICDYGARGAYMNPQKFIKMVKKKLQQSQDETEDKTDKNVALESTTLAKKIVLMGFSV